MGAPEERYTCFMDDTATLLVSLFVSTVGFAIFMYGRKQSRVPQLAVGVLMMVTPYFLPSALVVGAVGGALAVLLFVLVRLNL